MARFIKLKVSTRCALRKRFGVTRTAINDALSFKYNSARSKAIRDAAVAAGGVVMEPSFHPACETVNSKDFISQKFENGNELIINKGEGTAVVKRDGKVIARHSYASFANWNLMMLMAASE